jgi:hypothetical protein
MDKKNSASESFEISRDELYERVWVTPISHLAESFGVSGSYLARVCTALNVPRPPVGFWQKKAVGKAAQRPELPPALPGDQLLWSKDKPLAVHRGLRVTKQAGISETPKIKRSGRHPMLLGVEEHYRNTRKIEEFEFLRPYKKLLPDIVTSENNLVRSLDVASALYNALNGKGHRVLIAPPDSQMGRPQIEERETPGKDRRYGSYSFGAIWSPHRSTITYIGSVPVGLALTEMTERVTLRYVNGKYIREDSKEIRSTKSWQLTHSWTTEQDIPSGRLRLIAYSPMRGVDWISTWQESVRQSLIATIPEIIRKLEGAEDEIVSLTAVAEEAAAKRQREWEDQRERYRREDDQRRVAEADAESRKQLAEIMERWQKAITVERFLTDAEALLQGVECERRKTLSERLALARSMLGSVDPLDFLETWLAPEERYKSKYADDVQSKDEEIRVSRDGARSDQTI